MKVSHIRVLFMKQVKDTLKNKGILIQFLMFPLMTLLMVKSIQLEDMPSDFFVKMFGSMYLGMAPLVSMSSILAEEKEQNTLRMLLFSNVKASEYLIGIGGYVFLCCTLGSLMMGLLGNYTPSQFLVFMISSISGILISILLGAFIGVRTRNQMEATSFMMPLMMIFSFMPMLSTFNDTIARIGDFIYTQQINLFFEHLTLSMMSLKGILVIVGSLIAACMLFVLSYRKKHTIL